MILLAEATKAAETFAGLSIPSWILLLTTIGAGLAAFLKWLEARASKREAFELEKLKLSAELERDVLIEGVELGGHAATKAAIKKTALERDVPTLGESVKKATRHFKGPIGLFLACVLLTGLAGCVAKPRSDALFYADINAAHAADAKLPPAARAIAQDNADAWAIQAYELGGAEPAAEVFARLGIAPPASSSK